MSLKKCDEDKKIKIYRKGGGDQQDSASIY